MLSGQVVKSAAIATRRLTSHPRMCERYMGFDYLTNLFPISEKKYTRKRLVIIALNLLDD